LSAVWIVLALFIVGAVVVLINALRRGDRPQNLGAVSDSWIAEHRFGPGQDSRR
jgi:hypothetical protein